jgi:hypothetical protein
MDCSVSSLVALQVAPKKPNSGKSRNWPKKIMDLGEKVGPVSRREGFAHLFLLSKRPALMKSDLTDV